MNTYIKSLSDQIREETIPGANTKERVSNALDAINTLKSDTDNTFNKKEVLEMINEVKLISTAGIVGILRISDPKPTISGKYELKDIGSYLNLTPTDNGLPIIAEEGKFNYVYYDGTSFTKLDSEISNISPEQTTFVESEIIAGKNKANPANRHDGHYVNWDYGNIDINGAYDAFADLPILPDTAYFIPGVFHYAWKKTNGDFISGENIGGASVSKVSPSDAAFLSFDVAHGSVNVQLEEGTSATSYEPYSAIERIIIPNLYIPESSNLPDLFTISKVYWASGKQLNVFYDNVVMPDYAVPLSNYLCETWAGMGASMQRLYRTVPTSDTWFRVIIEDGAGNKKQKDTSLYLADINSGSGITRKILTIGDSTVNAGVTLLAVKDYFNSDVMDVSFLGTRATSGVNHEGRPGWSFENYMTSGSTGGVSNAFWDGSSFNFSFYMSNSSQSMASNDWVFIQLGINDLFPSALIDDSFNADSQISLMKGYLSAMISSIRAYNAGIRIGIVITIPPSIDQDALGFGLNNSIYVLEKYIKKGLKKWWIELISLYDNDVSISNNIYLVPANMVVDRKFDFPTTIIPIDAYNSNTIEIQSDAIHLTDSGYKKIADTYIGLLKYMA